MENEIKYYTISEVAQMLSVKPRTVRRWIKDGKLESVRFGDRLIRVSASAVSQAAIPSK